MTIARRILSTIPALIGILVITFCLLPLVPGDPVDLMLGEQANSADKQTLRHQLELDTTTPERALSFVTKLAHGDLGTSFTTRKPITPQLTQRAKATAELAVSAMLIALFFGLPLGIAAAVNKHADRAAKIFTLAGTSLPSFWIGPLLVYIFALKLDWLPVSERGGLDHLVLPSVTLAIGLIAVLAQVTRAALKEVLDEDYIRTAKAKGVSSRSIYAKHALANALIPIITISALQFGAVLTGTVIIETIFDWPGLGTYLYQAIQQRDYPVVQATVLVIALTYAVVNMLAEVAYAVANPRLRT